jgi:(2R)-ethylmalonyl-CoA mutase
MTTEQVQQEQRTPGGDRLWLFRTYAGHSTAAASNALFRKNLAQGQTGLSVAFDLPTQTGYDSDHALAAPEVGKVGVPISHLGDMRTLFEEIPLERMNTSMTINATAAWLLALYIALAEERGLDRAALSGTTQNDIIKEYLSHRRRRLHRGRGAPLEPDQCLLLSPSGGRGDAGAGAGLRARQRDRGSGCAAR